MSTVMALRAGDAANAQHAVNRLLPQYGPSLVETVLLAMQEATDNGEREASAATRIQSAFRMHIARVSYRRVRAHVLCIQRVYRGHAQRAHARHEREHVESQRQLAVFHYYATSIQACYRGYHSRKHKDDYYARKRYLYEVVHNSNDVLALSEEVNAELAALVRLRESTADYATYTKATEKAHHLLSTEVVSGVYRRFPPAATVVEARTRDGVSARDGPATAGASSAAAAWGEEEGQQHPPLSGTALGLADTHMTTTFRTSVENDIRANAAVTLGPELARTIAANASTKLDAASPAMRGLGGGIGDGLSVGGVPETEVRRDRQVRRGRYGNSVRASHYPKTRKRHHTGEEEGESGKEGTWTTREEFAATAPVRVGGATVASRSVGTGAEAGRLPPIRPAKNGLSSNGDTLPNTSTSIGEDAGGGGEDKQSAMGSSSPATVPWENKDALPVYDANPAVAAFDKSRRGKHMSAKAPSHGNRAAATAAASSRSKRFHVMAHDCRDHVAEHGGVSVGRGGDAEGDGKSLANLAGETQPLYDTDHAALQRSVDAKVRQALHGKATFKV